jgi:hypothetical protein
MDDDEGFGQANLVSIFILMCVDCGKASIRGGEVGGERLFLEVVNLEMTAN